MKLQNVLGVFILGLLLFWSCGNDDDNGVVAVPPRDLAEVALENNDSIEKFLQTHFYNYEEFLSAPEGFDYEIVIDTIAGENSTKTPLIEQVSKKIITRTDYDDDVPHTLYYLIARIGVGDSPTVADSTLVRYRGNLLDGTSFDSSTTPFWFDLLGVPRVSGGTIRGVREFMPFLKAGGDVIQNPDGTVDIEGFGVGMVFLPSGLAYFSSSRGTIPSYSPLIFRIDLLAFEEADHDQDGVPSYMEDLNGNDDLFDDDTDGNGSYNYVDVDDDGDGVFTRAEISDENGNIIFPYPDTDGDGTPDYLDKDN